MFFAACSNPAIKATLPDGADSLPPQPDGRGAVRIWLDRKFIDRLAQMRGPGESYSDVVVRLAEASEGARGRSPLGLRGSRIFLQK
jgi:hypothetical protein